MKFRFIKILMFIVSFFFLTGFFPVFSILGPGLTAFTSGNVYKAGAQYMINKRIEDVTGKKLSNFDIKCSGNIVLPNMSLSWEIT